MLVRNQHPMIAVGSFVGSPKEFVKAQKQKLGLALSFKSDALLAVYAMATQPSWPSPRLRRLPAKE